jgi:membrane protease YdiL (CAAX protease family)
MKQKEKNMLDQKEFTPITRIKDFVAQHQLIAFFLLTFAISWTVWFVFPSENGFSTLGGIGPLFSAVIITALLPSETREDYLRRRLLFFLGTFMATMLIWLGLRNVPTAPRYDLFTGIAVAVIFAFAFSGFYSSRGKVRKLLAPLAQWRVGWLPWAAVFILAPMLVLFGVLVDLALGGQFPAWPLGAPALGTFAGVFGIILFSGGGMEEIGWRGFALPRLQKMYSPLLASILIAVVWALWHMPLYFNGQYTSGSNSGPAALAGILFRFEWSLPLSVIFTWVYNRSQGSLLVMVLFHTIFDWMTGVVPISYRAGAITFLGTFWIVAIVMTLTDQMWRKTQPDVEIALAPAALAAK